MIAALALTATLSFAQDAPKTGHWEKKPRALLFFDADGELSSEHHLGPADDGAKEAAGGISADKRLAWLFEKTTNWNASRTRVLSTQRRLRLLGSDGRSLWESSEAEQPLEGGAPFIFAADGLSAFYSEKTPAGWRVVARDYMSNVLAQAGPFPELQEISLTPDGRFAMARWTVPDKSATHTFLDVKTKIRKDVDSDTFELGQARLRDDGKVVSGGKVVIDLNAAEVKKP